MKLSIQEACKLAKVIEEVYVRCDHISKYSRIVKIEGVLYEFCYSHSDFSGILDREVELFEVEPVEVKLVKYVRVNRAAHQKNSPDSNETLPR